MTSSDDESVEIIPPSVGVVPPCFRWDEDECVVLPITKTGICRPTRSTGDGGTGRNVNPENPWSVIFRGPDGLVDCDPRVDVAGANQNKNNY